MENIQKQSKYSLKHKDFKIGRPQTPTYLQQYNTNNKIKVLFLDKKAGSCNQIDNEQIGQQNQLLKHKLVKKNTTGQITEQNNFIIKKRKSLGNILRPNSAGGTKNLIKNDLQKNKLQMNIENQQKHEITENQQIINKDTINDMINNKLKQDKIIIPQTITQKNLSNDNSNSNNYNGQNQKQNLEQNIQNENQLNNIQNNENIQQSQNQNVFHQKQIYDKMPKFESILTPDTIQQNQLNHKISSIKTYGKIIQWYDQKPIGQGAQGQVYKAINYQTKEIFTIKKINIMGLNQDEISLIEKEIQIMKQCKHQNIIKFLGSEILEDKFFHIYLEYMQKGSLRQYLQSNKQIPLPMTQIKIFCKQILNGIKYLHNNNIVHKDIKSGNILIDQNNNLKLADFGTSKLLEQSIESIKTQKGMQGLNNQGSVPWMPPEIILQSGYKKSADIWSFGCTVLEMLTGKIPWSEHKFENQFGILIQIGSTDSIPQIPDSVSNELKQFILGCLQRDKNKRFTAQQLLNHPFLSD